MQHWTWEYSQVFVGALGFPTMMLDMSSRDAKVFELLVLLELILGQYVEGTCEASSRMFSLVNLCFFPSRKAAWDMQEELRIYPHLDLWSHGDSRWLLNLLIHTAPLEDAAVTGLQEVGFRNRTFESLESIFIAMSTGSLFTLNGSESLQNC